MNFLRVLCVLCGLLLPAYALDRHAFTFTDYDLEVTLIPVKSAMDAKGTLTLRNDSAAPQSVVALQISSSLEWNTITVAGKPVQYLTQQYTSDIDHTGGLSEAIVTLPAPVPPQGTVKLDVRYAGDIVQDASRLTRMGAPEAAALRSDWDRIADPYSAVRGVGYVAWYPVATEAARLSAGNELFDTLAAFKQRHAATRMKIKFRTSPGEGSGRYGILANDDANPGCIWAGPGMRGTDEKTVLPSCAAVEYTPLGNRVPAFAVGEYRTSLQPVIRIDHLAGRQELAADYTRVAARVSALTQHWFGPRWQQVHLIELPSADYVPWESGPTLFAPLKPLPTPEMEVALAHPMAHASLQSPRPWIEEGLAHFAQALQREQQDGRRAAIAYMEQQTGPLVTASQTDDEVALQPLFGSSDEIDFRIKAMRVWWMLRDLVGDEPLRRALQAYRSAEDREPSYVQRLVEAEAKRDLEWFFRDWVYRDRGLPDFRVESAYPRQTLSGLYIVTVTVENPGAAGAEVPVLIESDRGEVSKRLLVPAREKAVVRIEVPSAPRRVVVNDGSVPESDSANNAAEIKL